jgi:hypothetical protein
VVNRSYQLKNLVGLAIATYGDDDRVIGQVIDLCLELADGDSGRWSLLCFHGGPPSPPRAIDAALSVCGKIHARGRHLRHVGFNVRALKGAVDRRVDRPSMRAMPGFPFQLGLPEFSFDLVPAFKCDALDAGALDPRIMSLAGAISRRLVQDGYVFRPISRGGGPANGRHNCLFRSASRRRCFDAYVTHFCICRGGGKLSPFRCPDTFGADAE